MLVVENHKPRSQNRDLGHPAPGHQSLATAITLSSRPERRDLWFVRVTADPRHSALVSLRCGKPQISPLRCAPVEMTKLGVIANQAFLNPIFIPLGGPQAHERSGRDDNTGTRLCSATGAFHRDVKKPVHFPVRAERNACVYAVFYGLHRFRCAVPQYSLG